VNVALLFVHLTDLIGITTGVEKISLILIEEIESLKGSNDPGGRKASIMRSTWAQKL